MTTLLLLAVALIVAQGLLGRRARRDAEGLMRPADEWDEGDVERWLALIEPFPLRKPTPKS